MATIYLLFGMGLPTCDYPGIDRKTKAAFAQLAKEIVFDDFCLKPVYITRKEKIRRKEAVYAIHLKKSAENHEYAQKIADALCAAITLVGGEYFPEGLIAYPIDTMLIKNGVVPKDLILAFDYGRDDNEHLGEFHLRHLMDKITMIPKHIMFYATKILLLVLQNEDIFEAVQYYQDSLFSVAFNEHDVLRDPDKKPRSAVEKKKYENAAHNAFKAIEAILGEPPKCDEKLRRKLNALGINPDEKIGYADKESIFDKLRKFHFVRDKKSAHAKTGHSKTITDYELMDFQGFAQHFIKIVVDRKLEPKSNECKTSFPGRN